VWGGLIVSYLTSSAYEKLSENVEVWALVEGLEDEVKWLKKLLALEPSDRPSFKKRTTLSVVRRAGGVPVLITA